MTSIAGYADKIMALIGADMDDLIVPSDAGSWADLGDHVDANFYVDEAGVPWGTDPGSGADGYGTVNAVCAEVSARLAAWRAAETHGCQFTSPAVAGQVVTGISRGVTRGRAYTTTWSGTYRGLRESEWVPGQMCHWFENGTIGETPQRCFAIPASQIEGAH